MIRLATLGLAVGFGLALSSAARAAETPPDTDNGRYTFSPSPDGMLRLDTRNGAVSTCKTSGAGWACYAVPDERAAFDAEIGRLQAENDRLRAQLVERDKSTEALPKSDSLAPRADGERKIEIPLPSDRDMDRVMSFMESAWKRLVEFAARMQRDAGGKI